MRTFESMQERVPEGTYFVIRVDGRGFHRFVKIMEFERPFDKLFNVAMIEAGAEFMNDGGMNPIFAYGQSDEISFLFHRENDIYNRRIEKLCSVAASFVGISFSSYWSVKVKGTRGFRTVFDARVIPLTSQEEVIAYFDSRQEDAWRNCVHSHAFWKLVREKEMTGNQAAKYLEGMDIEGQIEIMIEMFDFEVTNVVNLHQRGWTLGWHFYEKLGYNPITEEDVIAKRRGLRVNLEILWFSTDEGKKMIEKVCKGT